MMKKRITAILAAAIIAVGASVPALRLTAIFTLPETMHRCF